MEAIVLGKLPSAGDFVARGVSPGERAWWDAALSRALVAAMAAVGADFAMLWDTAPPWRFSIRGPGGPVSGVIGASVDAVGRRFPLVTARRGRGWAAGCEGALFAAFAAGQDADTLHRRLTTIPRDPEAAEPRGWWLDGGEAAAVAPVPGDDPAPVLAAMLAAARVLS